MTTLLTLTIGFSVIASGVLLLTYIFFLHNLNKSPLAMVTGSILLGSFVTLQLGHLTHLEQATDLIADTQYRLALFTAPSMFYLFSRSILFDEQRVTWMTALHCLPIALVALPVTGIAIPILFCIGTGYSFWLTHVIYTVRFNRQRSAYELFFLFLFSVMAVGVLVLGFALPYMDHDYFYKAYTFGIGAALILVVAALLAFPELLGDIAAAAKARYESSSLQGIDVPAKKQQLEALMQTEKVYQQEDLNLSSLAQELELSSHQLSELINTEFDVSFSRYIRQYRVMAAKTLLDSQPEASILSISMEVGFKSQSNFYAAFKEITGQSPGTYRKRS